MDIDLNEGQEMLRKTARSFLTAKCPGTLVRELMEDERGYSPELWQEITELGWLGLAFPEEYGGEDGNFLDLAVLLEEMGRVSFPAPFFSTVVLGGLPIIMAGNKNQREEYIPRICKGELLATLALEEQEINYNISSISLSAKPDKDDYVLSGTKMFVQNAHAADLIICAARTSGKPGQENGITLFLVQSDSPGLNIKLLKPLDGSKPCEITFNNVKVTKQNILGTLNNGSIDLKKILELAAVAKSAEMLGGAQTVLDLTVQYAKDRFQFGQAIGAFQAIQHRCANMAIDVDGMRLTTYQAAWMLGENITCAREVAIAKAWASDAFNRIVVSGLKVHGGTGFMEEHDLSVHYRKAMASEYYFGDADFHRNVVLQSLGVG